MRVHNPHKPELKQATGEQLRRTIPGQCDNTQIYLWPILDSTNALPEAIVSAMSTLTRCIPGANTLQLGVNRTGTID